MKGQNHVSPQRGMPVDDKGNASVVTSVTGETVQLYYYNSSNVLTADAGQAAGVAVVAKLAYDNVKNALGDMEGSPRDTSLSFTSSDLTTEVALAPNILQALDEASGVNRLNGIVDTLSNGQYVVDYTNGVIYGKKASTGTTLTSAAYKVNTPSLGSVTVNSELAAAIAGADNTANPTTAPVLSFGMLWDGATWDRAPGTSADGALVNLGANNDVDTELAAAIAAADNVANPTTAPVLSFGMLWDGATWDRMKGDSTDGLLVNLGANNDVTVTGTVTEANSAAIAASLSVLDDWDESDRLKANIIVGQAGITAGAGAVAANTPRVTLASDDPAVVSLQLLDDAIFIDDAAFTPGTSKGLAIGMQADETSADSVDEGDFGVPRMTLDRRQRVANKSIEGPGEPTVDSYTHAAISAAVTTADQSLVAAPGANKQIWVYGINFVTAAAGTVSFQDEDNTAISGVMSFAANGGMAVAPSGNFSMPLWKCATNKALEVDTAGGADAKGSLSYAIVSV